MGLKPDNNGTVSYTYTGLNQTYNGIETKIGNEVKIYLNSLNQTYNGIETKILYS